MAPALVPFALNLAPVGGETVEVDGRDITRQVRALTVTGGVDEPTRLTVELIPGAGPVVGEGIVEVIRDGGAADMVRNLDPATVRTRVEARIGSGASVPRLYLDVVAEILDGQVGR